MWIAMWQIKGKVYYSAKRHGTINAAIRETKKLDPAIKITWVQLVDDGERVTDYFKKAVEAV